MIRTASYIATHSSRTADYFFSLSIQVIHHQKPFLAAAHVQADSQDTLTLRVTFPAHMEINSTQWPTPQFHKPKLP